MKKSIYILAVTLLMWGTALASDGGEVRSLIFMIGDGMGLAQVSMLQLERGDSLTAFDRAQGVALIRTRSANSRVTDSAAAGTALSSATKTGNGHIGVDMADHSLHSMMERAHEQGMPTGIAVTCYLQHATPAAFYAHVPDRNDTEAITRDLLASGIDVLFGGGRKWLAEECPEGGSGLDALRRRGYFVTDNLEALDTVTRGRVACVAAEKHLEKAPKRGDFLLRATGKALEVLGNEAAARDKGFLLMVEGSQIDKACHGNDIDYLKAEMRDFDRAVAAAMDYADRTPGVLVVVVADHETGGFSIPSEERDFTKAHSDIRYNFSTGNHSATMVPAYFYGAGADRISGVMENSELSHRLMELLGLD